MVEANFFLQAFGVFFAVLVVVALLRWTFSEGRSPVSANSAYRRPLFWVAVAVQILFVIWLGSVDANCQGEVACDSYSGVEAGLRFYLILLVWIFADVILAVVWVSKRTCPACGSTVKKTLLVCPACRHGFSEDRRR